MFKMICKCGEELNSFIHREIEYKIFSFEELISLLDQDEAGVALSNMELGKNFIWKCLNCERIYIFDKDTNDLLRIYRVTESDGTAW